MSQYPKGTCPNCRRLHPINKNGFIRAHACGEALNGYGYDQGGQTLPVEPRQPSPYSDKTRHEKERSR